ncbi:prepilin-type N-terminal cleavage/methylation domain-containing protein [Litorimonas haliclonae]|uniref:prepilin-type N-terminal cleavage/methylation domain-containing protein n=1 Tax=Litorimonas haliclonae TaxID=2081977 RepID=UPI0039F0460F
MKHSEAGFTLIEMLCVLVLISLLSGVVIMNIPNPKSPAQIQAEGLTRDLNAMAQEGLISGEVRAFGLTDKQFSFYAYDGEKFIPAGGNNWSDEIRTEFTRNGEKLELPETLAPQIMFEPTSINTPFVLDLSGRKARYEVRSEGDGRVVLVKTE